MKSQVLVFSPAADFDLGRDQFSGRELSVLDAINQKVASAESLEGIIDFLFEASQPISSCDRLALAFFTEGGHRVTARYARASYQPLHLVKGYSEDSQGSTLQQVWDHGGVRVINDLKTYFAGKPQSFSTELMLREGIESSMTCPLTVSGRRIGLLFRSSRKPKAYDQHEVKLHLATAERLSQAVEKAYRIEELQNAIHAYYEMLGFVSHELKSPLASIVLDGSVLLQGYLGDVETKQRAKVEQMVRKAEFLLGLTREYLDLTRIESGRLDPIFKPDVDLIQNVVEPAIEMVQSLSDERHNRLVRAYSSPAVKATVDTELLRIVMVNLLSNAVKYSHDGGEIKVSVEDVSSGVRLSVWNEGPGFPEAEKGRLFRKFSRLQSQALATRKGTGVGLYTAWRILQIHRGHITADSELGKWARFTVDLPRR